MQTKRIHRDGRLRAYETPTGACYMVCHSEAMVQNELHSYMGSLYLLVLYSHQTSSDLCPRDTLQPLPHSTWHNNSLLLFLESLTNHTRRRAAFNMGLSVIPPHTPCGLGPLGLAGTQVASGHQARLGETVIKRRKRYTKSKKGCVNCVQRHLHCNENWPQWSVFHLALRQ